MNADRSDAWGGVSPLVVAVGLLREDAPWLIMGAPQEWGRWGVLLPHVLAVVEHAVPALDSVGDPGVVDDVAWLLDRAGTYLQVQGRAAEGKQLLEQALTITETTYGPDHPTVATSLSNLALILRDLGDPAAAQPLAERALTITETTHGPHHPHVATSLNNLATILQDLGDPAAAQPLAERALTIAETSFDPNHPLVEIFRNNLRQLSTRTANVPPKPGPTSLE